MGRRSAPPSRPPAWRSPSRPAQPGSRRPRRARGHPPRAGLPPRPPTTRRPPPGQTLRQRAEADAAAILRSFAVPPGGHRLAGPPNLPGGVLKSPISYLVAAWEVHVTDFWEAPGESAGAAGLGAGAPDGPVHPGRRGLRPARLGPRLRAGPRRRPGHQGAGRRGGERGRRPDRYPGGRVGGLAATPFGRQPDPVRGGDGHHRRVVQRRAGRLNRQPPARPGHDHRPGHGAQARGAHQRPPAVHDPAGRPLPG